MSQGAEVAELRTGRLILRNWRDADREPFAALNMDPQVMEHFASGLPREQSDVFADRIRAAIDEQGWGLWAVEVAETGEFIGFTGLQPCVGLPVEGVEIGWRLARAAWGHGFATEAAIAARDFGFTMLGLPEVVAVTATTNLRSQAVMRRIGMVRDPEGDFDHPRVPEGHPVRRHVLFRVSAP
jgi:ribosomal-protein-alanine N-acetyltransferase